MTILGKGIRLERIINRNTKRTVIVPMDHGVALGPIAGLVDIKTAIDKVAEGGANAILGHIGFAMHGHRQRGKDIGLILHLSASTSLSPNPLEKVPINTVQHALKMGADAVSVHINVGAENEKEQLADLGRISLECREWGMPLLGMMYPRGKKVETNGGEHAVENVKHSARLGAELGVDIIKTNYTGSIDSFREVVNGALGVPVIIAGGPKESMKSDESLLAMVHDAIEAGAAGTSIGRNIFQHKNPEKITRAIAAVVHEGASVKKAVEYLK